MTCKCVNPERKVWIDCMQGEAYPAPARYSTPFKDLHKHWTISPDYLEERRVKQTIVSFVQCCVCQKEVRQ